MKFVLGLLVGAVVTYGLIPVPWVLFDKDGGAIQNATLKCVGVWVADSATNTLVAGNDITTDMRLCPGFVRTFARLAIQNK